MEISIKAENIHRVSGGKTILEDLSFSIRKGEVFGFIGHNGAGKSTTIDCLLGFKKVQKGKIFILNKDPRQNRQTLFEKIGVQFQSSNYANNIKVKEICEEMCALYKNPANYNELLLKFNLHQFKDKSVDKLSGGEKQKLSVVLSLIPNPEIIFLDELTTGLDVVARRKVWKVLKGLKKKGITIFLTSHYMDEVEELCDRICILKEGKIVKIGDVKEIINNSPYEKLEEAYLWYLGEELTYE